ncbi:hypothetical protein BJ165DRAFT_1407752 [Panaeolus papilionaceus]|nr:hypothetical protein BJ165DRAFT_1407752 [Panaeolus papilionaceus]
MAFKLSIILMALPLLVASSTLHQSRAPPAVCQPGSSVNCCTTINPITDIPDIILLHSGIDPRTLEGTTYGSGCAAVIEDDGVCSGEIACCEGPKLYRYDDVTTLNCVPLRGADSD